MKIDFNIDDKKKIKFNNIDDCDHQVVWNNCLILIQNETLKGSESWSWFNVDDCYVFGAYNDIKDAIEDLRRRGDFEDEGFDIYDNKQSNVNISLEFEKH